MPVYRLINCFAHSFLLGLLFTAALVSWLTPASAAALTTDQPGDLVSYNLVEGFASQRNTEPASAGALLKPAQSGMASGGKSAENAVQMYVVVYRTPDISGELVEASGLVMFPEVSKGKRLTRKRYPLVSFQHGTIMTRNLAPSNPAECVYTPFLNEFASMGYVISMPDYLGYGVSQIRHPYGHAETEASASRDMLRAARKLSSRLGVRLNGRLFLTGYSQGGRATMALQRMLEQNHPREFKITASGPGGGPYDHFLFWTSTLKNPNLTASACAAYMLVAYNRAYGLGQNYQAIFKAPYSQYVDALFDGTHLESEIGSKLPPSLQEMLQPDFIENFTQGLNLAYMAFVANNTNAWRPKAPVRLFHSRTDEAATFAAAELTAAFMKSLGADVEVVDVGNYEHVEAFPYALQAAKDWFDTF